MSFARVLSKTHLSELERKMVLTCLTFQQKVVDLIVCESSAKQEVPLAEVDFLIELGSSDSGFVIGLSSIQNFFLFLVN